MPSVDVTLGNLVLSGHGQTAQLSDSRVPGTALLIISLAKLLMPRDKETAQVKSLGRNVAQASYDYDGIKEGVQLTVHWDEQAHPELDMYTFVWKKPAHLHTLQDGISLKANSQQFWYGGVNLMDQRWPIDPALGDYKRSLFGTNDPHLGDSVNLGDELTFWYGGFHPMDLEWPINKTTNLEISEFVLNDIYHNSLNMGDEKTFWYGGSNLMDQQWPMIKHAHNISEFLLNDIYQFTGTSGQERYWLSSKKVVITVPWNVPLWTAVLDGELQLQSYLLDSQFLYRNDHLEYTLTVPKDPSKMTLKDFHQACFKKYLKAPTDHPDIAIMEKPIWSTWANFWTAVNQTQVEDYAKQIKEHSFPISQLELDDMWTTKYGDYQIDSTKFPDFTGMVKRLRENYSVPRLTAWVHPFVQADSVNGKDMELRNKIFIKDKNGDVPLCWWWDCPVKRDAEGKDIREPCAYILDLTNPDAQKWWHGELKKMQKEGIYTFKFDAGETNWFPKNYTLHSGNNPNNFGQDYAYFSAQFGNAVENRYGSGSQQANIFMRTMDRNSFWDHDGGLFTLIPWALQSSLHGYFWNLPDMIGGNGINHEEPHITGEPPEAEMYIRWTQANAFLLAMQFSYPPWHKKYGSDVVEQVKKVLSIREKWMPYIIKCVKDAVKDKEPVIRPMWWESDELAAFASRDQYMVGKDLVVAPVVNKGQQKRDIFLPPGTWQDGNHPDQAPIQGPGVKKDYSAPLDTVPFFHRVGTQPNGAMGRAIGIASTFTGLLGIFIGIFVAKLVL